MPEAISNTLTYWFLQTLAMALTALLIPKLRITSLFGATTAVAGLAFINATLWDVALFFSIPDSLSSRTLLLLFANGAVFWALVKILPGIESDGPLPVLLAPIVFTVLSIFIGHYGQYVDWAAVFQQTLEFIGSVKEFFLASKAPTS